MCGRRSSQEDRNCLKDIKKSAFVSLQMMNQVLDIYRFETEQSETIFESVEVCQVCKHMANRYEPLAAAKNQTLLLNCATEIVIQSNQILLKSILGNLLSNAIKFNDIGGMCKISTTLSNTTIRIEVSDNGPGFSEEERYKVFGKFQKLSAQPTGSESTSGLGLYMVKVMVEKLGGTIRLSANQERGATFVIELPK